MKCNTCIHEWIYPADFTSPYGEYACIKKGNDLYRTLPKEVENCEDYECRNKNNDYTTDIVEDIKVKISFYDVLVGNKLIR
jgi:hypothetical protein